MCERGKDGEKTADIFSVKQKQKQPWKGLRKALHK